MSHAAPWQTQRLIEVASSSEIQGKTDEVFEFGQEAGQGPDSN